MKKIKKYKEFVNEGYTISSDICNNLLYLTTEIEDYYGDDSIGEFITSPTGIKWLCVSSGEECGKRGKLYGSMFIKTENLNIYHKILEIDDYIDHIDYINKLNLPYVYYVTAEDSDNLGAVFCDNINYVEIFKEDFNETNEIIDIDSFSQFF
jgi:hypothetical protein